MAAGPRAVSALANGRRKARRRQQLGACAIERSSVFPRPRSAFLLLQRKGGAWIKSGDDCQLAAELRPEPFVDDLRIGLAGHRLHRLADEKAEQRLLAALILGDLVSVVREDLVDRIVDRTRVAGLLQSAAFD